MIEIKYEDGTIDTLNGYSIGGSLISISGENIKENLSGFKIVDKIDNGKEIIIADGTGYKYRWDVINHQGTWIYYTNDEENKQTVPFPEEEFDETSFEMPLSNEELTDIVGDLMFEVSLMEIGL